MSDDFITKDSGQRRVFETGSVRDSRKGKGRFDLIPAYPLKRLAQLYERGAEKYADNNWQKGQNLANYLDSAMRHLNDYRDGDRSEDHLIAVAWNIFAYVWTERAIEQGKLPASLGDVDKPEPAGLPAIESLEGVRGASSCTCSPRAYGKCAFCYLQPVIKRVGGMEK
jgi:hypothetical protein